jgi:hypothetical protein
MYDGTNYPRAEPGGNSSAPGPFQVIESTPGPTTRSYVANIIQHIKSNIYHPTGTIQHLQLSNYYPACIFVNPDYQDSQSHNFPYGYPNRTIYLNGISNSILNENYKPETFGNSAVRISVRWDKYNVVNDVRWCPHSMRHSPNNFNQSDYSVNIKKARRC